jgi:hypothetical protein
LENLDAAFTYCSDPHIDSATKNLILNMIRSIRSVVPANLPPESKLPDAGYNRKDLDEIRDILLQARIHAKEFEGVFNLEELQRYSGYAADSQEIVAQIEKLYKEMKTLRDYTLKFSSLLAGMVEEHLKLTIPQGNADQDEASAGNIMPGPEGPKLKIV